MTANRHRGEVEIELLGRKYLMRPTWQALAEIERETGKELFTLARQFLENEFGFRDVTAVITAGLKAVGEPATFEKVADLVFRTGFQNCCGPAASLLIGALRGDEEDEPGEAPAAEGKKTAEFPFVAT